MITAIETSGKASEGYGGDEDNEGTIMATVELNHAHDGHISHNCLTRGRSLWGSRRACKELADMTFVTTSSYYSSRKTRL